MESDKDHNILLHRNKEPFVQLHFHLQQQKVNDYKLVCILVLPVGQNFDPCAFFCEGLHIP